MFCECKEAEFKEFKEFWTRNGDHYCTLFFRHPLRFLELDTTPATRHTLQPTFFTKLPKLQLPKTDRLTERNPSKIKIYSI